MPGGRRDGQPGDKAGPFQPDDQTGDVPGAYPQSRRKIPLRRGAVPRELPQQVRPRWGQTSLLQRPRHVFIDEDGELQDLVQQPYRGNWRVL